jgi:hypothetical protein
MKYSLVLPSSLVGVHLKNKSNDFWCLPRNTGCVVLLHEAKYTGQAAFEGRLRSFKVCSRADACRDEDESSNTGGLTAWISHKA